MGAKREQILWDSVWDLSEQMENVYSLKALLSAGMTEMLGHSSKSVTRKFYNDMDYIKYVRVNQLPVKKWLDI